MTTYGPYQREQDTYSEPMPAAVRQLHADRHSGPGFPYQRQRAVIRDHILAALADAGVDLGDHDRRIVGWLAAWEPSTVQAIIGWVSRANQPTPE